MSERTLQRATASTLGLSPEHPRWPRCGAFASRADVIIREPGPGLLWGAGMFGCTEAFHSEAARLAPRTGG